MIRLQLPVGPRDASVTAKSDSLGRASERIPDEFSLSEAQGVWLLPVPVAIITVQ